MTVTAVNSLVDFKEIINGDEPVIFDFWAAWCGPCVQMSPIFEKSSEENPSVRYYKVDIEAHQDIAQEVEIRSIPAFIIFKKGEKLGQLIGAKRGETNPVTDLVKAHTV